MIVDQMALAGEELDKANLSDGEPMYQNEIRWARMHLVNAGKLELVGVSGLGVWQLTAAGWEMPLDEVTAGTICGKESQSPIGI